MIFLINHSNIVDEREIKLKLTSFENISRTRESWDQWLVHSTQVQSIDGWRVKEGKWKKLKGKKSWQKNSLLHETRNIEMKTRFVAQTSLLDDSNRSIVFIFN